VAAVFAGGVAGALSRAAVGEALTASPGAWPWATFLVNVAGAGLLGWVLVRAPKWRRLVATGFCGALTTFSTFQFELLRMLDTDHVALAAGYAAASVASGLAALRLGEQVAR
jgi:CrcB protein